MAKSDGERGREIRFSCSSGTTSAEGVLLYRALADAVEDRRASELLRVMALRGWLDLIHGVSPGERLRTLRSIGISEALIEKIEVMWPRPLIHDPNEGAITMGRLIQAAQSLNPVAGGASLNSARGESLQPSEPAPPPPSPTPVDREAAQPMNQTSGSSALPEDSDEHEPARVVKPAPQRSRLSGSLGMS